MPMPAAGTCTGRATAGTRINNAATTLCKTRTRRLGVHERDGLSVLVSLLLSFTEVAHRLHRLLLRLELSLWCRIHVCT